MRALLVLALLAAASGLPAARVAAQVFGSGRALNSNAATDNGTDVTPHLVTDGAGLWGAAWTGTGGDILFARSTDDGATWSPALMLNPTPATQGGGVQLATDGTTWIAIWNARGPGGADDSDVLVVRSTDGGVNWSAPTTLNSNPPLGASHDLEPRIATDGVGTWIVVWDSDDTLGDTVGSDYDILFSRSTDAGVSWTAPAALNTNAGSDVGLDREPAIATDGATWLVVWSARDALGGAIGTDDDIVFARSMDAGVTWSAPAALNANAASDSGNDYSPQVATDGAGTWVAVWTSTDSLGGTIGTDEDILFARSVDGGATWSFPAPLNVNASSDGGANDDEAQIATDRHGTWVAVWYGATLGGPVVTDDDIRVARSVDGGASWSAPLPMNDNPSRDRSFESDPFVATDGAGTWLAVWDSQDSLGGTIGDDFDILVARGRDVACSPAPRAACAPATGSVKAKLTLKRRTPDTKDLVQWQLKSDEAASIADFGAPTASDVLDGTNHLLCVYDGAANLLMQAAAPAGGRCGIKPCWKAVATKGFDYRDGERTPAGLEKVQLRTDGVRQTSLLVKGSGEHLAMPALGGVLFPVTVQLQGTNARCWQTTFGAAIANDDGELRARLP